MGTKYVVVPSMSNGDWVTPAWLNVNLKQNTEALWPYTSKGDIPYAIGSDEITRLPIGSVGQLLTVAASGIPAWSNPDILHVTQNVSNYASQTTASPSLIDVTGVAATIVTARPCRFLMLGSAVGFTVNTSYPIQYQISFNGSIVGDFRSYSLDPIGPSINYITGTWAAGTYNIKLQFCSPFGVNVTSFGAFMSILALAAG